VVHTAPQPRERGQHEVHQPIQIRHVARQDLEDGLGAQQDEGALHSDFEGRGERAVGAVEFGVQCRVAGRLDELVALPREEFGRVGLLQKEEAEALDEGGEDGCGVEAYSLQLVADVKLRSSCYISRYHYLHQRQVVFWLMKPPAMGPMAGPRSGAKL
jgi:hypothetical protein